VIAEALPEARFIVLQQSDATHPLRALPQIKVRDEKSCRAAVLGRKILAVKSECDPSPIVLEIV
jgi:hypothetical protein